MCYNFRKKQKQKKPDAKPQTKMPCWILFHVTAKDQTDKKESKTKGETGNNNNTPTTTTPVSQITDQANTPSLLADLPSISVMSIGGNQKLSLSNPLKSTVFEWNKHSSLASRRSSQQTKETPKENTKVNSEKEKNEMPLPKCLKDEKG